MLASEMTREEAEHQAYITLLNAAHDVTCTGCGWCDWTGQALHLQLTTGHTPFCPVTWGEWCDDASGCPRLADEPTEPCSCRYSLGYVAGVAGTHQLDPYRGTWHRGVYAFRINPACPHHGRSS